MMPSLDQLGIRAGDKGMSLLDLKGLKKEARLAQPESSRAVTVAASGGVDSSVTLAILAQMVRPSQHERDSSPPHRLSSSTKSNTLTSQPVDIDVVFMRNWDPLLSETQPDSAPSSDSPGLADLSYSATGQGSGKSTCSWEQDWNDVRAVCSHLGIPLDRVRLMDFSKEYWSRVFEPSVAVWEAGGTPNPDVMCNREIKFGALLDAVMGTGSRKSDLGVGREEKGDSGHYLATGHYARVVRDIKARDGGQIGEAALWRAVDGTKDQSYYLSAVTARQLQKVCHCIRADAHWLALQSA